MISSTEKYLKELFTQIKKIKNKKEKFFYSSFVAKELEKNSLIKVPGYFLWPFVQIFMF